MYQTARSGKTFTYAIPVPPGLYTIQLKFAELWLKALGKRPMDITINGLLSRHHFRYANIDQAYVHARLVQMVKEFP